SVKGSSVYSDLPLIEKRRTPSAMIAVLCVAGEFVLGVASPARTTRGAVAAASLCSCYRVCWSVHSDSRHAKCAGSGNFLRRLAGSYIHVAARARVRSRTHPSQRTLKRRGAPHRPSLPADRTTNGAGGRCGDRPRTGP